MIPFASATHRRNRRTFSANCPDGSRAAYITRLIASFEESLEELALRKESTANPESLDRHIESMASFIYESMTTSARNYHHVKHVFDVIETNTCATEPGENVLDPTAVLAALFHDCVYANVDGGLSAKQREKLQGAVDEGVQPDGVSVLLITHPEAMKDRLLEMVLKVFGFQAGQTLQPNEGQNEFLSAVIAVRELEPLLPQEILMKIAACIEATIPFRGTNEAGISSLELLFQRVQSVSAEFGFGLSDEECVSIVRRATLVANEDIGSFGTTDYEMFVDRTWSLLPETNEALRDPSYSILDFHAAVYKMYKFFSQVNAGLIFHQFRGFPSDSLVKSLTLAAEQNIGIGFEYVGAKLVGVAFLAAFAVLTGGDAPIQIFMGTNHADPTDSPLFSMADRLQLPNKRTKTSMTESSRSQVYKLLTEGRHSETSFDLRSSPLSTYLYNLLGAKKIAELLKDVDTHPMTEEKAKRFLRGIPRESVSFVGKLIAEMVDERQEAILKAIAEF